MPIASQCQPFVKVNRVAAETARQFLTCYFCYLWLHYKGSRALRGPLRQSRVRKAIELISLYHHVNHILQSTIVICAVA